MDKVYFHHLMLYQVKSFFCLFLALGLVLVAAVGFIEQQQHFLIIQGVAACVLCLSFALSWRGGKLMHFSQWLLLGLLFLVSWVSLASQINHPFWVYLLPIFICFVFSLRQALVLTLISSLLLILLMLNVSQNYVKYQILFSFLLSTLFALICLLGREISENKLKSLINFDPVARIYNEYQLEVDLSKEMMRADRLTEQLHLVAVSVPSSWFSLGMRPFEQRMRYVGNLLVGLSRKFDACYRLDKDAFVVLMPHSSEEDIQGLMAKLESAINTDATYQDIDRINSYPDAYHPEDEAKDIITRINTTLREANHGKPE